MWSIGLAFLLIVLAALGIVLLAFQRNPNLIYRRHSNWEPGSLIGNIFDNYTKNGGTAVNVSRQPINGNNIVNASPNQTSQLPKQLENVNVTFIYINAGRHTQKALDDLKYVIDKHKPVIMFDNSQANTATTLKDQYGYQRFQPSGQAMFLAHPQ